MICLGAEGTGDEAEVEVEEGPRWGAHGEAGE